MGLLADVWGILWEVIFSVGHSVVTVARNTFFVQIFLPFKSDSNQIVKGDSD